jgi:4-amino-4-deoxy-L-arabinose transferase-like glycosyltransferase
LRQGPPAEAVLIGLGLFALLAAFAAADPATKMTASLAPFTDEGFNVVNARNFIQLGRWTTDEWNLQLVNLPFSILQAVWFGLTGPGIVQARLVTIACVSLTATALVWGLRGVVGRPWAAFAGVAFAASGLVLFYGRLAFLEDLVVLGLTLGTLVLAGRNRLDLRGGALAGLCYAVAIGTKPSAAFSVLGILLFLGLVWGWRDPAVRRWMIGSTAVIAISGLIWALAIWLPNQAAVAIDTRIWPAYQWNLTPSALYHSIRAYLTTDSDNLFGVMLLPLIALSAAGLAAMAALRRRMGDAEARLAAASIGWAVFGFGILIAVSYRPNRYVVPLVPALAIIAAIGLHLFAGWLRDRLAERAASGPTPAAEAGPAARAPDSGQGPATAGAWRGRGTSSAVANLIAVAAIIVAAAPGLIWYGGWARNATYDLVAIQNRFADQVPAGESVAGRDAALFLMRSKATTVVVGLANNGNLYETGTRWYLAADGTPAPTGVSGSVWAARVRVTCADWNGETECLYHLP